MDIRPWRYIFVKTVISEKTILKRGDGPDVEHMDTIGPNFTVKIKGRHSYRTYDRKTRPIPSNFILRRTVTSMEWGHCFYNQMTQWMQ